MRPERLLLVVDEMEVGGSQRQIQHLLAGLDRERWAPELAYFRSDSFLLGAIQRSGVPVHYLPKRGRIDVRFLLAFTRLLRRRNYALIHAFSQTAEIWSVLASGLSRRTPVLIASERSFAPDKRARHWLLKRVVVARSAAVIANSRAGARSTARHTRMPEAKFAVIGNGVALPPAMSAAERAALRRTLGAPAGRAVGLFVGRLVHAKNLSCLMEAVASLPPGHRPWIALAGEGPMRALIQAQVAAAGISDSVCLLGEVENAVQLMQAADFLVLPSHFEGQSNALLEAMAAGCPVIASRVGGTPELVEDGRTGVLFPPGDARALAAAMASLASEPDLRKQLADAAREFVARHHSAAALAAATSAVYERCLAAGGRRPGRAAGGLIPSPRQRE
ncbi:glycosyltransferase [Luteimonas sp. A478]